MNSVYIILDIRRVHEYPRATNACYYETLKEAEAALEFKCDLANVLNDNTAFYVHRFVVDRRK